MKKTQSSQSKDISVPNPKKETYNNLLVELKSILDRGQAKAYKAVDNIKVQTYWQIGERIVRDEIEHKDRADYGKVLVKKLSKDMNFGASLLYEIIGFFKTYPIFHTVCGELSWSHYGYLIKIETDEKRNFYQQKAINNRWSVRELNNQINNQLFENTKHEKIKLPKKRKIFSQIESLDIFKDIYDLGFAGKYKSEKELENGIVKNIDSFLHELGHEISYCGRQIPVKIDGLNHYIDLLFYHKGIPCNILVELKTRKLDARDVGQMNKYVNYFRLNRQYEHEKDTIGLIICSEAGIEEAQYALGGLDEKIFIATYKSKLPTVEQLKVAVEKIKK